MPMKPLAAGLTIAMGLAAGAMVSRALHSPAEAVAPPAPAKSEERPQIAEASLLPSSDTLETLKDPNLAGRQGRLAIWLPHASLAEVQALWESLNASQPVPSDLVRLVLARWVVLDPQGALSATRKPGRASEAWTAWAAWDPRAAEAAARASDEPGALILVLQGLAGRDPDYVAKLLETDSKLAYALVPKIVDGFIAQRRYDRALDTALRLGGNHYSKEKILLEWSREDPEQLLLWGALAPQVFKSASMEMPGTIAREQMDKMPGILAKMPSGEIKSDMRSGYVLALAEKDPAAALRYAEGIDAPLTGYGLLGELGRKFTASNPPLAVEILSKLLEAGRPLDEYQVAVFFLDGQRPDWHSTDTPFPGFAEDLIKNMPELAMDAVMASADKPAYQAAARQLAADWMEKDEWDFGGWLKRQPSGALRDELALEYANRLAHGERPAMDQAIMWTSGAADSPKRDSQLDNLLMNWKSEDAGAYRAFISSSAVPEVVRKRAKQLDNDE